MVDRARELCVVVSEYESQLVEEQLYAVVAQKALLDTVEILLANSARYFAVAA